MRLLERDGDLVALRAESERSRTSGRMVVISGESGAGKSALVQAFLRDRSGDTAVLWGACDPLTTPRPLGPLHDMVGELGDEVVASLLGGGLSHEIFAKVYARLRETPSVFVVDDLHWADQGTIDLLRFLLRRLASTRSLVVGTLRDDELGASHPLRALLGDVARSPDALCMSLEPLSVEAVATMIEGRPIDPVWLHELTGGNPFFAAEVLAHDGDELPITVRDAVLARAAGLDEESRDVLDLLACAPEAIPDQLLPHLGIGMLPLRALDEAGLLSRGPRGIAFRHDMCRLAIASAIPPGGEVALHRRMLEALDASGTGDPAVMAHHALGAQDAERVLRHASVAGLSAARAGAHTQAAAFFHAALEHGSPPTAIERAELLELLAGEWYLLDRLHDAIDACEQAMELRAEAGDRAGVSANHEALSLYQWYNANRSVAERHASEAISVLGSDTDLARAGHAYACEAYLSLQATDLDRASAFTARARQIAAEVDDPQLDLRLGIIEAACALLSGDGAGRSALLSALAGASEHFDEVASSGYSNLAYLDVEQRRLREAGEVLEVSIPLTVERDVPICHVWQLGARGRLRLLEGDWEVALADADEVLTAPSAPLARTWPHLVRGLVSLRRGGSADEDLEAAWRLAQRFGEPLRLLPAAAALVERAWLLGTADDFVDEAHALLVRCDGVGLEWSRGDLAVWLRRVGRHVDLDALDVAEPHRLQLQGADVEAAERWAKLSAPYERALALVDAGDAEGARLGLDLLDRLEADAVAAKLRRDLRDRGVTSIPARRRATTRANPAGLTARQIEVLALLAEGLTNAEVAQRLFISPKTADHHVSAILAKLQVSSRRDAPLVGRQMGIID